MIMALDKPILIAGAGSIGRRHLKNLQALGHKKFVLYRTGKSTLPDDETRDILTEYDLARALAHKPIATIVANPTALHMPVALAAARAGSHLFLEKPISHTLDGISGLRRWVKDSGLIVMTGFHFRFHPGLQQVKRLLEKNKIGPVVSVQAHWGEYLPGWHQWEDYRQSYAAKKKLGGGVLLTLCHPFDYLRWLIGDVTSVSAVVGRNGGLEIDVEDTADVLLNFASGAIGNVHLDYLERPDEHYLRVVGQSGVIHWDNSDGLVKWQTQSSGKWEKLPVPDAFERNTMYISEMRHFLSCITGGGQPLCTLSDGVEALRIVLAAKQSAREKRFIRLT